MQIIKTILQQGIRILRTLLGILALAGVVIFILNCLGIQSFVILSGSMEPGIPTGGVVLVDTREKSPEIGDVITFLMRGEYVTHRVKSIKHGQYETKGDVNTQSDRDLVSGECIIGTAIGALPLLGYAVLYIQSAGGLMLLSLSLFLLALMTVGAEYINKIAGTKNRK